MAEASNIRLRNPIPPPIPNARADADSDDARVLTKDADNLAKEEDELGFSLLEVLRAITLLLLLSGLVSWFVTQDSFTWGLKRPQFTKVNYWTRLMNGPIYLTDDELRKYDGSDSSLPIYLAINGTIFDVTPGSHFYGPGGSYHFFAGADASRSFVTSCFDSDITPDMRGVEEMFLPTSTPEIDELYTSGELKAKKEQERRLARKSAHDALRHWVEFFEKSDKYDRVGFVRREEGWLERLPRRELCEKARKMRPVRKPPVRDGK